MAAHKRSWRPSEQRSLRTLGRVLTFSLARRAILSRSSLTRSEISFGPLH